MTQVRKLAALKAEKAAANRLNAAGFMNRAYDTALVSVLQRCSPPHLGPSISIRVCEIRTQAYLYMCVSGSR